MLRTTREKIGVALRGKKKKRNILLDSGSNYLCLLTPRGQPFIIDREDFTKVMEKTWYLGKGGYVVTASEQNRLSGKRWSTIYLHRYVLGITDNKYPVIDHINRVPSDNRKSNLRICTLNQNSFNKISKSTTGLRGVSKHRNKYAANIKYNKKQIWLGDFNTPEQAAKAYYNKVIELYGEGSVEATLIKDNHAGWTTGQGRTG